ncbi:MAG: PstS family phosphate ABC transporter substrate-binding protein [Methanothrix sp.]|nr:MAG: PstS family phosphate ABC transporter substrate-binding protein [Methanothrix sp.]
MNGKSKLLIFLLVVLSVTAIGSAREQKVTLSGSSTAMPLAELAAEEFNMLQDDYHVSVTSGGTGVGIVDVAEGRSDIAMASREIQPVEKMRYETGDEKFQEFLVGYDAICLVVSPRVYNFGVRALTKEQVKQIYSGSITNWKGVGGPDEEIFVIGRRAGSGTRDTFNEVIMGSKEAESPGVIIEASDSSEVKTAIRGGDNAIGYVGFSYVLHGDTKVVSLDGVGPTIQNIKDGKYPLARKLYFYTLGKPSPGAMAFIKYILSPDGQKIALENGFIPA